MDGVKDREVLGAPGTQLVSILAHQTTDRTADGTEIMIRSAKVIDGFPTEIYQTTDREEFNSFKVWCRKNIGRSHGRGSSWWTYQLRQSTLVPPTYYLCMRSGPYTFLARMIWE